MHDVESLKNEAKRLAKNAKARDCYCLIGDLGAGKTEFARAFIQELCGAVTVSSPTFNILQVYERGVRCQVSGVGEEIIMHHAQCTIYHFDLYRLKDAEELQELGLDEALETGITLIEWPQLAEGYLPDNKKEIHIEILDEKTRRITIK